ncbi:MAG: DNA-formamidopyrimidine glycosylase [Solirubrobacterales bacterium]|nr:DNA-formamidopyrimidine glycosylase [Solirubrobacterales bacterium]
MPELPEVEITARLIGAAVSGVEIESVLAPGINALKSFDPPLSSVVGLPVAGVRRRGKLFLVDVGDELTFLIHLMSAGRLQLWDKRAGLRDRTSRLLVRLADGRELRLREFGTRQRAWVSLLRRSGVEADPAVAELGPEAWPSPPAIPGDARPLYTSLRDQHAIAGIGRSWVDEILWSARLSPFKRGADLSAAESSALREAIASRLGEAIAVYERDLALPLPDKLPLPLQVHRHNGEPCPRCGTVIEAVFYEDYVMCYCPQCQTEGKVLKDRRLSRLLK